MDRPETAYVRSNGQLTLPAQVRRAAEWQEGDLVEVSVQDDGSVLLRPVAVLDRLQADRLFGLGEPPAGEMSGDVRERARQLVHSRQVPRSTGRRLYGLADRFQRGHLNRRAFVGEALVLGLPVTSIADLLGTPTESREMIEAALHEPGAVHPHPPVSGDTRVRIVQAFHSLLYLPLYVAYDAGFFAEEGVDVEIATAGGGPEAWSAVEAGVADYAVHDPVFVVAALEQGVDDAVVVGTICNGQAILALAADDEIAPTEDPQVFISQTVAGRTVSTQPRPDSQWALLRFLKLLYDPGSTSDFRNLQTRIGTEPEPVLDGRADICLAFPPQAELALAGGLHEVFDFSRHFGPYLLSTLTARRGRILSRPHVHAAVLTALEKACQYAHVFPDEAIRVAVSEFPEMDEDVVARAARRCIMRHFLPEHCAVDAEAWHENFVLNRFAGSIKQYRSVREAVDNEAALHAYRTLGNLGMTWRTPRDIAFRVSASPAGRG